jgi:hypothetical protein
MQFLLISIIISAIGMVGTARAETKAVDREALAVHHGLDVLCRGGSGDATSDACEVRVHAEKLLGLLGYCYGTKADFAGGAGRASATWHKNNGDCAYRP